MTRTMTVVYRVERGLSINLTNRCTNLCEFCIRKNGDGAYGTDSLWLLREPTVDEVIEAVNGANFEYDEIVFCGYGEPTVRLCDMLEIAKRIKKADPKMKIRVNTNGHSSLIFGYDTAPKFSGLVDCVSISLNAPTAEKYTKLCNPKFGEAGFFAMLEFAKNVKKYVQNTAFSVVKDFLSDEELSECRRIAEECGVALRVRDYIS